MGLVRKVFAGFHLPERLCLRPVIASKELGVPEMYQKLLGTSDLLSRVYEALRCVICQTYLTQ
eukprot:115249-Amphidinium_carterae.1